MTNQNRFWARVKCGAPDECWPWTGSTNGRGYGRLRYFGKHEAAHRVAFALRYDRRSEQHILHSCDNPTCCNPAHLREGTHVDNMMDRTVRGRSIGRNAYSDETIRMIRELHTVDGWTACDIAALCQGTPSLVHIRDVLNGRARPWCITYGSANAGLVRNTAPLRPTEAPKTHEKPGSDGG